MTCRRRRAEADPLGLFVLAPCREFLGLGELRHVLHVASFGEVIPARRVAEVQQVDLALAHAALGHETLIEADAARGDGLHLDVREFLLDALHQSGLCGGGERGVEDEVGFLRHGCVGCERHEPGNQQNHENRLDGTFHICFSFYGETDFPRTSLTRTRSLRVFPTRLRCSPNFAIGFIRAGSKGRVKPSDDRVKQSPEGAAEYPVSRPCQDRSPSRRIPNPLPLLESLLKKF